MILRRVYVSPPCRVSKNWRPADGPRERIVRLHLSHPSFEGRRSGRAKDADGLAGVLSGIRGDKAAPDFLREKAGDVLAYIRGRDLIRVSCNTFRHSNIVSERMDVQSVAGGERADSGREGSTPRSARTARSTEHYPPWQGPLPLLPEQARRAFYPHDSAGLGGQRKPQGVANSCRKIYAAVDAANANPTKEGISFNPFERAGQALYDELFPPGHMLEDLRVALRELKNALLISTDDPDIYWELLNDGVGEGFLGLKYDIGRRLVARSLPGRLPRPEKRLSCLIIADPNEDEPDWTLPETQKEAPKLRESLMLRNVDCAGYLLGEDATLDAVQAGVREGADIIHFAGHIVAGKGGYSLRLRNGELFGPADIRRHVRKDRRSFF